MKEENYMTPQEVCEYLSIKLSTLYKWIHLKKLPHKKLGSVLRFKKSELDIWVDNQSVAVL